MVDSLSITIPFSIFYFDQEARIVLTDLDGTITESDIKGHVFPTLGWEAHHDNVVEMFDKIADNGYTIIYLTGRPLDNDKTTRGYLFEVCTTY